SKHTLGNIFAGLGLTLGLFASGCSSEEGKAPCEGEDCGGQESPSNETKEDAGKKPTDAGKKTDASTVKTDAGAGGASAKSLPCDVAPLVTQYCGDCHGEKPFAPMSLLDADDFAETTPANVKARITQDEPTGHMPPVTSDQPSAEELAKIVAWLDKGAKGTSDKCTDVPKGNTDAGTGTGSDASAPPPFEAPGDEELECFTMTAHNGDFKTPYNVGAARDAYFNFTFAAPWKGTVYGITIGPVIDNMKAIHHWLLFQDDLPGVPGGAQGSIGAHPAGQLLYGWAPGGESLDFRKSGVDVGLELPGDGQTYTMEYHYNSDDFGAKDASGVKICVHHRKTANIAGLSWLGNDNLLVPATQWSGTCKPTTDKDIHIVALIPHMHQQGVHMKGTITRKDGKKEILHDEPFDFDYQKLYTKDVTLHPGESIFTECTFAQPMTFGESTQAEMCYLFTMAYPKGALAAPDVWGGFAHGGSSCLGM
ncbi:MAG: hypothetical protein ABW352_00250, partial [Polyangiales bacterium]